MKKLLLLVMVLGITLPSFGGIKIKDLLGTWKYEAVVEMQTLAGEFSFEKKDGELIGEVKTSEGETFLMNTIEIRENNVLYFELGNNGEVYKVTVTLHKDKFEGMVRGSEGEAPISGEKIK